MAIEERDDGAIRRGRVVSRDEIAPPGRDTAADRSVLERWVRAGTTPQRLAARSRIVLMMLDGVAQRDIAERLHLSRATVKLWIERFETGGPSALLHDAPGRGRRPSMDAETMRQRLLDANQLAADGRPMSLRRAAAVLGISSAAVWRALKRVG